jgi:hypothetical protein
MHLHTEVHSQIGDTYVAIKQKDTQAHTLMHTNSHKVKDDRDSHSTCTV